MSLNLSLDDEEIKFLKELAFELKNQDNRCTAAPYFYTVRQTKRLTGMDANYSSETVWVDMVNDYQEYQTYEAAVDSIMKALEISKEKAEEYVDQNFENFGYVEYEFNTNVFLTYKGFLEHMRLNAHNYPGKQYGEKFVDSPENKVYSYVDHAFRNPEMDKLIKLLKKIGDQL